jgi:hypothetical protein
MRTTYTFAIAAAVAVAAIMALVTKTIVFAPKADATVSQSTVSVHDLHRNAKDLPVLEIQDPI